MTLPENPPPDDPPSGDPPRTIIAPGAKSGSDAPEGWSTPDPAAAPRRTQGTSIQVGDVLNHMFEVKRFIARGGMGEVFEGENISSHERVAIKVILPALAADPEVQAMFRREAQTLIRIAHPALVQYRVMAREPQLDLLYIVTEYIDGPSLADKFGELKPDVFELRALAIRLAEGLGAAHALEAVHRDISPDNVLLEGGRLDRAKIIDFGIAKDLTPSGKTIVGAGFAGKLNYVAPEQLGDYGRDVGPWSDVYSLGLVLLAVAAGKDPDMGATVVDAVDRRRAGPDLSAAPAALRPVIAGMLVADPALRFRSMHAVLAALEDSAFAPSPPPPPPPPPARKRRALPDLARIMAVLPKRIDRRLAVIIAGAVAAIAVFAFGLWFLTRTPAPEPAPPPEARAGAAPAIDRARAAVFSALNGVDCSWIDITGLEVSGSDVRVSGHGFAPPGNTANPAINAALAGEQLTGQGIGLELVPIERPFCGVLNALRPLQLRGGRDIVAESDTFTLAPPADGYPIKEADIILTIDIGPPGREVALVGLSVSDVNIIIESRRDFETVAADKANAFTLNRDGTYRVPLPDKEKGLKGFVLVTAPGPIDRPLLETLKGLGDGSDTERVKRFVAAARQAGWQAQIVWVTIQDAASN